MAHRMLDGVTAAANSVALDFSVPVSEHTVEIYLTSGTVSACVIDLEGSIQNRNETSPQWETLASYTFTAGDLTAKKAMFHVVNKPVRKVRIALTTFTNSSGVLVALYEPNTVG